MKRASMIVVALLSGLSCAPTGPAAPLNLVPSIEVIPSELKLGTGLVGSNSEMKAEVSIKNLGTAPLSIHAVRSSCGCTVVSPPPATLQPNHSVSVDVVVAVGMQAGERKSTITIESNDPLHGATTIPILWQARPRLLIEPDSIDFGSLRAGERISKSVRITLLDDEEKTKMNLQAIGRGLAAGWDVEEGKTRALTVRLFADGNPEQNNGTLLIKTDRDELYAMLPIRWRDRGLLRASPSSLFTGNAAAGSLLEHQIILYSSESQPFEVTAVSIDGNDSSFEFRKDEGRASKHILQIRLNSPKIRGVFRRTLRFTTDSSEVTTLEVPWSIVVN